MAEVNIVYAIVLQLAMKIAKVSKDVLELKTTSVVVFLIKTNVFVVSYQTLICSMHGCVLGQSDIHHECVVLK